LLPVAAFASVYPFNVNPSPDIQVTSSYPQNSVGYSFNGTNLTITDNTEFGDVGTIIDLPGTSCPGIACDIFTDLSFNSDASGFTITGPSSVNPSAPGTVTYLAGKYDAGSCLEGSNTLIACANLTGVDYGELFNITTDDVAEWTALEEANCADCSAIGSATNINGDLVAFDFDTATDDADLELYHSNNEGNSATPEPTTLTLLGSGLAAGLLRKRLARRKK